MPLSFPFQHVRHFAATSGNLSIANHVSEPKILSRPIRFDYWRTTTFWCSPARSWKIFLKLPIQFAHPQTRSWYLNRVFLQKYSLCNHSVRKCGLIRDQEVTGSNPVAPTISFSITYTLSPSEKVVVANRGCFKAVGLLPNSHPEMPSSNLLSCRSLELLNFRSCNQL